MAWLGRSRDVDRADDEVDDFDEYDPTPYGGGYDLALTYGRPLPPTEETCYPVSTSSSGGGYDCNRPHYSSGSAASAYEPSTTDSGYGDRYGARPSHPRPKPQPAYDFHPQEAQEYGGGRPQADPYGSGYGRPDPTSYGSGGYGRPAEEGYGSGFGKPQRQNEDQPSYGSGYGRTEQYDSEYESGYGRPKTEEKSEYGSEYGSGYGRPKTEEQSEYGSGYGRPKTEQSEYGSGYGRTEGEGYGSGSGYGKPKREDQPSYGSGYGGPEYGSEYGRPKREEQPSYGYGATEEEGNNANRYGGGSGYEGAGYRSYEKPKTSSYGEAEEGYGRKKKDDDDSDSDEEKKKRREKKHQHRRRNDSDDE